MFAPQARDLGSTLAAFANMAPDKSRSLVRGLSVVVRDVAPFMAQEELAKVMWVVGMVSAAPATSSPHLGLSITPSCLHVPPQARVHAIYGAL
jgi:hypothetical protein